MPSKPLIFLPSDVAIVRITSRGLYRSILCSYIRWVKKVLVFISIALLILSEGSVAAENQCSQLLETPHRLLNSLPPHVREITGKSPSPKQSNCLNAVAYWHGWARGFTVWKSRKLKAILNDRKKVRKIKSSEKAQWGDIVVFRLGSKDKILHAAIFLTPNWLWQKEDDSKDSVWKVIALKEVFKEYESLNVEFYRPKY